MLESKTIPVITLFFCILSFCFLQPATALEAGKNIYPFPMSYYVESYNFINSDINNEVHPVAKDNLRYFIVNIAPAIPSEYDAQLTIWWAYIEGVLSTNEGPWIFSNCGDRDNNPNTDCIKHFYSGGWQVGYGIQVFDTIKSLKKAFINNHQGKLPEEIGDFVLSKAKQKDVIYPKNLSIEHMVDNPHDNTSGKSNAYWASVLMRDPKISAYLLAPTASKWMCYGKVNGKPVSIPRWCASNTWYSREKAEHSKKMKQIINTWNLLRPLTPNPPENLIISKGGD